MRTWYEALEEDYKINLNEITKEYEGISSKTLSKYKKEADFIPRESDQKRLVKMVKQECDAFTINIFKEYLDGKHAQRPIDYIRLRQIKNINDSIAECKLLGVTFDLLSHKQPTEESKLAEWIYNVMHTPEGINTITPFLERVRMQIDDLEDKKVFNVVKQLHDAIAPLVIVDVSCVEPARKTLSSMKGVREEHGLALAALSIGRSKGALLNLGIDKTENGIQFKTPENAIFEETFSISDDLSVRYGRKILEKRELIGKNTKKLDANHFADLKQIGENNSESILPLFIYLKNAGVTDKDDLETHKESLKKIEALSGFHKFSSELGDELDVLSDDYAVLWLLEIYRDLHNKEARIIKRIRDYIGKINSDNNEDLDNLKIAVSSAQTDNEVLDLVEKYSTILSNVAGAITSLSEAINNCSSLYEKAKITLSWLIGSVTLTGGS